MGRNVCTAAIFMMVGAVAQANQCSSGGECSSDEQSHKIVSLLQTKLHTTEVAVPSKTNEEIKSSPLKTNEQVTSSFSQTNEEAMSSRFTNAGTLTLQGRLLPKQGIPMACDIPICDRSCSQGPECCATQMFEAVSEITSWMESNNVEYVVLFGTLLGAQRDKDIIQWTGDVDIGIYKKDVAKLTNQTDIPWSFGYQDSFDLPRGCENHHPGFPGNYSQFQMGGGGHCDAGDPLCSYYIDLSVLDEPSQGGEGAEACIASSKGLNDHVTKTKVEIRGKMFDAPSQVEDCLVALYGPDWQTPDADASFHR